MTESQELHVVFGSGPIGLAVTDALVARGRRVRVINRRGTASAAPGVEVVAGDATDQATTARLSRGAAVVYNCTNAHTPNGPNCFRRSTRGATWRGKRRREAGDDGLMSICTVRQAACR